MKKLIIAIGLVLSSQISIYASENLECPNYDYQDFIDMNDKDLELLHNNNLETIINNNELATQFISTGQIEKSLEFTDESKKCTHYNEIIRSILDKRNSGKQ